MLKLLIGAVLFVGCGYIGFCVNGYYRKRADIFKDVLGYTDSLEKGISYLQSTLGELTDGYASDKKGEFGEMLRKYSSLLRGGAFSKIQCSEAVRSRFLNAYERNALCEMFFSLGKSDLDTQLAELAKYRALFSPIAENASQKYKKYGALSLKLGILAGLAALLITA